MKNINNKGFTVIELVGIILVLALIILVSFPALQNLTRSDIEKDYDTMVKNLCLAGQSYIYSNPDTFTNISVVGEKTTISIDELISYGNIDSNIKNPRTNESISGDNLLYEVLSDKSLSCEYKDN